MKIAPHPRRWDSLVDLTRPRPTTHGNLAKPSYFLASFQAATEGFYFAGPLGAAASSAASIAGIWAEKKTHSQKAGLLAGAATGAVLYAVLTAATGGIALPVAITAGALMGAQQVFRGDEDAHVRDSAGNATLLSAWFQPGYAKLVGGIAAGFGSGGKTRRAKIVRGALAGLVMGGVLGALGLAPGGILVAAAASGLAGGIGPVFGPRFSQFFRNLNEIFGNGMMRLLRKMGFRKKISYEVSNSTGAIPASFIKEGTKGFILSDLKLSGLLVGGVSEVIQQVYIIARQKKSKVKLENT